MIKPGPFKYFDDRFSLSFQIRHLVYSQPFDMPDAFRAEPYRIGRPLKESPPLPPRSVLCLVYKSRERNAIGRKTVTQKLNEMTLKWLLWGLRVPIEK